MQEHYFRALVREEWHRDPRYNARQAAKVVGVADDTLLFRFRSGEVPAFQRSPDKPWSPWWVRRSDLLKRLKRHDTTDLRSKRTRAQQVDGRLRRGRPVKVYTAWALVCQDCAEQYVVEAPPRARGQDVLTLAAQQHQCPNQVAA